MKGREPRDFSTIDNEELSHLNEIAALAKEYAEGSGDPKFLFHAVEEYEDYLKAKGRTLGSSASGVFS